MTTADYAVRTRQNVIASDGTLIIANGELSGGTRETLEFCREAAKPCLVIDTESVLVQAAVDLIERFSLDNRIVILNVAGPRASQWPEGHAIARKIVVAVLRRLSGHKGANE
jgi:hypothetical protein